MHPAKVIRAKVRILTDLPNVGPATAADLRLLGIHHPRQLEGKCPFALYRRLCVVTACRQDPCVLDVLLSVTRFMAGEEPRLWWEYTAERKERLAQGIWATGGDHAS